MRCLSDKITQIETVPYFEKATAVNIPFETATANRTNR
jgi:hypothetical protein